MGLSPVWAGINISCSHPELCRLAKIVFIENQIDDFQFTTLVQIKGDPHEFEPSVSEVKNLINAEVLISGPAELNPWIKKINYQRSKNKNTKTINILLKSTDYNLYPGTSHEVLSHFWLYPKIFCSIKNEMEKQFTALGYFSLKNKTQACEVEEKNITTALKETLAKMNYPLVLTHDALLPLIESLISKDKKSAVTAIKGSGHHQEASSITVKKLYDVLKAPKVIWILEEKIHVPQSIISKKRADDIVINIDTANSQGLRSFQILETLNSKLKAIQK